MDDQPYDQEQDQYVPCLFGTHLPDGLAVPSSFEVAKPQTGEQRCDRHGRITLTFKIPGDPRITSERACQWHAFVAHALHRDLMGAIKADLLPGVTL